MTVDAVLMYAQRGHGKRSSFYSDYTFGLWTEDDAGPQLVPVGKAYFGFTDEELYVLIAPRRTLDRRKASGEMLSPVESDRVQRIERIWAHGVRVFGEPERFARWLRSEIAALDDARPIDLLTSETGAQIVSEEIGRIDYGMLA